MKKILTLLLAVISLNVTAQKDSVLLRFNPEKGSEYLLTMKMEIEFPKIKADVPNMTTTSTMEMKSKVIDIKEDIITQKTHFARMVLDTEMQDKKFHYDSSMKKEEMDKMAQEIDSKMSELKSLTLTTITNKRGKVLEVKGAEGKYADMYKNNQYSVEFPKKAVGIGSTWSGTSTMNFQGTNLKIDNQYTVKEITDKTVVLTLDGTIAGNMSVEAKKEKKDIKMDIELKGDAVVDKKTGQLVTSDIVSTVQIMGQKVTTTTTLTNKKL